MEVGSKEKTYLDKDDLENALITQFLIEEWYPYFREFEKKMKV
jgi:hypothetical protein